MNKEIEISEEDFYQSMVQASIACLKSFAKKHQDKTFYGFSIETLAEEGYFTLSFNTEEELAKIEDRYREGERWNNQEWGYFDIGYDDEAWKEQWKPMKTRINLFKSSEEKELSTFKKSFINASIRALAELERIKIFELFNKTDYFRTEVFEHHDRW